MLSDTIIQVLRERGLVRREKLPALVSERARMFEAGVPLWARSIAVRTAAVEAEFRNEIHRSGEWWVAGPAPRMVG
jgi:hypothetical protein